MYPKISKDIIFLPLPSSWHSWSSGRPFCSEPSRRPKAPSSFSLFFGHVFWQAAEWTNHVFGHDFLTSFHPFGRCFRKTPPPKIGKNMEKWCGNDSNLESSARYLLSQAEGWVFPLLVLELGRSHIGVRPEQDVFQPQRVSGATSGILNQLGLSMIKQQTWRILENQSIGSGLWNLGIHLGIFFCDETH